MSSNMEAVYLPHRKPLASALSLIIAASIAGLMIAGVLAIVSDPGAGGSIKPAAPSSVGAQFHGLEAGRLERFGYPGQLGTVTPTPQSETRATPADSTAREGVTGTGSTDWTIPAVDAGFNGHLGAMKPDDDPPIDPLPPRHRQGGFGGIETKNP